MAGKSKSAPGIPESLKAPAPARGRRTAAFASSDPSIREKMGAPAPSASAADASPAPDLRIAGRFELRARGAGMIAVDTRTDRSVPFPKASTGVVQDVLAGLFGRVKRAKAPRADDALPASFAEPGLRLVLKLVSVRVDPLHPAQVLTDGGEGLEVQAYRVSIGRTRHGYVLVSGPSRIQVHVPQLQRKITVHTSLAAAVERVKQVAEIFRDRKAAAKA